MRVEVTLRNTPLAAVQDTARALDEAGVEAVCDSEIRRDPFMSLTLAAAATRNIGLATAVTIAFPRSPMVVAYAARNIHDLSGGRFRLGLGTQVRRHIVQRFSTPWDSPGPRLRDYVNALRAIWRTWENGEPLSHRGPYYSFEFMTPEFNLGPAGLPPIAVDIAAVNPYNIELAGQACDGIRLHRFITPEYLRDVVWPQLRRGAERAGRELTGFTVIGCGFVATGRTAAEVEQARERARARVGFYGSTPAYRPVLEHHGWAALHRDLAGYVRQGRWNELAALVPDDVLDAFCLAVPYDRLPAALGERYGGLVDTVQLESPPGGSDGWDDFAAACRQVARLPTAGGHPH